MDEDIMLLERMAWVAKVKAETCKLNAEARVINAEAEVLEVANSNAKKDKS